MNRIANRDARKSVQRRQPFDASNIYARRSADEKRYVVYSYRDDWPMFVYDRTTSNWYENKDKVSRTTSKHRSQAHPHPLTGTTLLSREDMVTVADHGFPALAAYKLNP